MSRHCKLTSARAIVGSFPGDYINVFVLKRYLRCFFFVCCHVILLLSIISAITELDVYKILPEVSPLSLLYLTIAYMILMEQNVLIQ